MLLAFVMVASIGWTDHGAFRCPEKAQECIDPSLLPNMPPIVRNALSGAACSKLDRPGGVTCDTAITTAVMAACPVGETACWRATWLRALAPNLEHGLDVLVRGKPSWP